MRSCARQRLVAASSRRTEEKVASRRGSGRHWRSASRARALSLSLFCCCQYRTTPREFKDGMKNIPQEAPNNMFEEPSGLLLDELRNHIAEDGADSVEALISGTDVVKTIVIEQNLLDDENSNRLAELRPGLHDSKAEGNDLGREEEVDDLGRIVFDKRTDDPQRSKPEVFKRARLRRRVQERVEEEGDVR